MPLINCPECGREVSDAANACPHCGFPLLNPMLVKHAPPAKRSTPLEETKKNPVLGVFLLILGILGIPAIFFGFMLAVIPGFMVLFGDLFSFAMASNNLKGTRKGTCPYCSGNIIVTDLNASAVKCPQCKKRIAVKEDRLETLE